MLKKSLLALLLLAILAGGWYWMQSNNSSVSDTNSTLSDQPASSTVEALTPAVTETAVATTADNPLAAKSDATQIVDAIAANSSNSANTGAESATVNGLESSPQTSTTNAVDATTVAIEPLSDAQFIRLEQQIKTDPALRAQLLDEYRYNTDPERAQQLAALLGPYDDPAIVQTASELVYSGDPQSRIAGLDLLSRVQPRNDEARNVAIELLSSESEPEFLIATMNVLATPSQTANNSQRQRLNDNLGNLSSHYDANVRAQSLSLLGRWDKNSNTARDALTRGLNDPEPSVRSSAAFSINNIDAPDENMITGLLNIAEDTSENRSTRYAALRALEKMQLNSAQLRRFRLAQRSANRRN